MKHLMVALIAALSILICLSFAAPLPARGEAAFRYAYAKERDKVYFYGDKKASSALFAIPETYCVEILKDEGEWCYCRYAKDEGAYKAQFGYCLKSDLTFIEEPLENEYLNYTLEVEFCAEQGNSQIDPFKVRLTVAFYGNGTMNSAGMSCVGYGGGLGYVPDTVNDYPLNDVPQPTVSTDVTEPENSVNVTLIVAAVITVIAVVAVAVLYFAGKRPKLPPKTDG